MSTDDPSSLGMNKSYEGPHYRQEMKTILISLLIRLLYCAKRKRNQWFYVYIMPRNKETKFVENVRRFLRYFMYFTPGLESNNLLWLLQSPRMESKGIKEKADPSGRAA